jgi:hypothetical protein
MVKFAFFSPDETPPLSTPALVAYYFTNVASLPISMACIPFSLRIILQLYNNMTTLEMMKNVQVKYPCWGTSPTTKSYAPNPYDMLWLPNMRQVLGPRLWMWPLPVQIEMKGKGFYFPRIPEITSAEISQLDGTNN